MNTVMAAVRWHRGHHPFLDRRSDETGASAVEYGLLIAGVTALIVVAVFLFGHSVLDLFVHTCDTVGSTDGAASSC